MKRLRIIGSIVLAILAVWLILRSCGLPSSKPPPTPPPAREAFHAAKPLRIELLRTQNDGASAPDHGWLERELRFVLARGKMKLAALPDPPTAAGTTPPFTLRLDIDDAKNEVRLALVAPDGVQERTQIAPLAKQSNLELIRSVAAPLPRFLGAPTGAADWSTSLGTSDAAAYDAFIQASDALLQPTAVGFTSPPEPKPAAVQVLEHVETLARRQRDFSRARALLSLAYLSVGGEDQASLAKLAETAAERALAADPQLADAHAALGIVRLRRMNWVAAQEHFETALAIDASSLPALEGLACLLVDVGHSKEALPIAARSAQLQPGSRGARECLAYAELANSPTASASAKAPFDLARIYASMLLLSGDRAAAEAMLKESEPPSMELIDAVMAASAAKDRVPEALKNITRAADEETIDAETELLFGTALRRPDFVFNRMLRLAKQSEPVPLRVLWLPQTDFLRKQRRFREVVNVAALSTYWQDHGVPDVCAAEPKVTGCAVKAK